MVTIRDREGLAVWFSSGDRLKLRRENSSSEFLATKIRGYWVSFHPMVASNCVMPQCFPLKKKEKKNFRTVQVKH